jgi:hypothetical protein
MGKKKGKKAAGTPLPDPRQEPQNVAKYRQLEADADNLSQGVIMARRTAECAVCKSALSPFAELTSSVRPLSLLHQKSLHVSLAGLATRLNTILELDYAYTATRKDHKLFEQFYLAFRECARTDEEVRNADKYRQWVQVLLDRCVEVESAAAGPKKGKKKKK